MQKIEDMYPFVGFGVPAKDDPRPRPEEQADKGKGRGGLSVSRLRITGRSHESMRTVSLQASGTAGF